ncbi:NlpC/P60 family protein [Yinghuangia aomiensis]
MFFNSDNSHVGLYIGDGVMIHAPHTGTVVKIAPISEMPLPRGHAPGLNRPRPQQPTVPRPPRGGGAPSTFPGPPPAASPGPPGELRTRPGAGR